MTNDLISFSKPHQTVLLCVSGNFELMGKTKRIDNLITVDWHMPTSLNPPLYCVSIGKSRFSLKLLSESNCFSINFMAHKYEKEVLFCGTNSGLKVDKFKETGLTAIDCEKIDSKFIKEAESVYECEVVEKIDTGDHILFIGKIISGNKFDNKRRLLNLGNAGFTTTLK